MTSPDFAELFEHRQSNTTAVYNIPYLQHSFRLHTTYHEEI